MTEVPKKTVRKRAPPKPAGQRPTLAQRSKTKTEGMDDHQNMRERVLACAIGHAAFEGFTDSVLQKAGAEAGLDKKRLVELFPEGPISLVEFYSTHTDAQMQERLAEMDLKAMKVRQRIATAIQTRLAIMKPHKEAARRAAALLLLPMHAARGAKLIYHTVDSMWRAAGDTSTDFNFYTKRGILAGVYSSTLLRWFNDTSQDEQATKEFLNARIDNVMQFEALKARTKKALADFAPFAKRPQSNAK